MVVLMLYYFMCRHLVAKFVLLMKLQLLGYKQCPPHWHFSIVLSYIDFVVIDQFHIRAI